MDTWARTRKWLPSAFVVLAVAGLVMLLFSGLQRADTARRGGLSINTSGRGVPVRSRPAPDFSLDLFGGGVFRLRDVRGRPVAVNFWASWCPPCREEARELEAAWRDIRGQAVLVGVNVWDTEQAARDFLQAFGISYPNGPDPQGRILIEFGVTGIPETFFVDPAGAVVGRWVGPITQEEILGRLRLDGR